MKTTTTLFVVWVDEIIMGNNRMPRQSFDPIEEAGPWGWVIPAMIMMFFLILMCLPWLRRVFIELVGREERPILRKHRQGTKKEKQEQRDAFVKQMRHR